MRKWNLTSRIVLTQSRSFEEFLSTLKAGSYLPDQLFTKVSDESKVFVGKIPFIHFSFDSRSKLFPPWQYHDSHSAYPMYTSCSMQHGSIYIRMLLRLQSLHAQSDGVFTKFGRHNGLWYANIYHERIWFLFTKCPTYFGRGETRYVASEYFLNS